MKAFNDAELADHLRRIAIQENRTPAQLMAASLKFYLDLPGAVRTALCDVDALGNPEDRHNLVRAIGRTVASSQYEIVRRRVAEGMQLDREDKLNTDEIILAEAVRVTSVSR